MPRLSLPTTTNALFTPGRGLRTTSIRKLSQRFSKAVISSLFLATNLSINSLCPSVPTSRMFEASLFLIVPVLIVFPVTFRTSSENKPAAFFTTSKSCSSTYNCAFPFRFIKLNSLALPLLLTNVTCAIASGIPNATTSSHKIHLTLFIYLYFSLFWSIPVPYTISSILRNLLLFSATSFPDAHNRFSLYVFPAYL